MLALHSQIDSGTQFKVLKKTVMNDYAQRHWSEMFAQ